MTHCATRHGSLCYSVLGKGPPLFLLPANGHDARDFDAVRVKLAQSFQTIAVDWPGMGASAPLAQPDGASAFTFAEMLEDVVVALAREPALLVGHSVGGFASAHLAATRPELVRALILVDSGGFVPLGRADALFCRLKGTSWATRLGEGAFARFHTKRRNPDVAQMLARIERARRGRAYAATVAAVWRSFADPAHDLRPLASLIACPTLIVWGEADPVVPLAKARPAVAELLPTARFVALSTGHSPFAEDPPAFLATVLPFVAPFAAQGPAHP